MASAKFNIAKKMLLDASLDLAADTIKALLVMTNTTADTDIDADTVGAIGTLDEFDGSGYTAGHGNSGRKTLALTAAVDDTNDRGELTEDAGSTTWSSISAGTRDIQGVLLIREGTSDDTDAIPIGFFEFSSAYTPNGGDLTVNWDSEGVFQVS